jgi:hypothetical protein
VSKCKRKLREAADWFAGKSQGFKITCLAVGGAVILAAAAVIWIVAVGDGSSIVVRPPIVTVDGDNLSSDEPAEIDCDVCQLFNCICDVDPLTRFTVIENSDGSLTVVDTATGDFVEPDNYVINADGTVTISYLDGEEILTVTVTPAFAVTTEPEQTDTDVSDSSGEETTAPPDGTTQPGTTTTTSTSAPAPASNIIRLNGNSAACELPRETVRIREKRDDDGNPISNTVEVTIREPGSYVLTGTLRDGQIVMDTKGDVRITLRNANITNSDGPAIRTSREPERGEGTLTIISEQGTTNTLIDARPTRLNLDDANEELFDPDTRDARNGAIFSRADLTITGRGRLNITGGYQHGINSRASLTINNARVTVENAAGHGTRSRHGTTISNNSELTINSGRRGIRAAGNNHGNITITASTLNIKSGRDAIQAEVNLIINDSTVTAVSAGGWQTGAVSGMSLRGLRSMGGNITIFGGTFNLDCAETAIDSSGNVNISGATMNISTSRRAIRSFQALTIRNSNIHVNICQSGLRGRSVNVEGGSIYIHSRGVAVVVDGMAQAVITPRELISSSSCQAGCH